MIEDRVVVLTKDELREVVSEAALKAATIAVEHVEDKHAEDVKRKKDKRIHNTDLLLKQYRALKKGCENAVYEKTKVNVEDVLDELMGSESDAVIVDSIRRSVERTEILITHVDKMLEVFRIYCSKCSAKEKREYKVVKALFIANQKKSIKTLAKEHNVTEATIYNDIKSAKEKLSVLFFGINGLHFR